MRPETFKLEYALTEAYKELLRQPQGKFRIENQPLYAHVLHAVAGLRGVDTEQTQNEFELMIAQESDSN